MYRFYFSIFLIGVLCFSCKQRASVTVTDTADSTGIAVDTVVETVPTLTLAWETDTTLHTP